MEVKQQKSDFNEDKFRREAVAKELAYRRDKLWRVFSWASTLIIASIGGIVALKLKSDVRISLGQRIAFTTAILILGLYSVGWCYQIGQEKRAASKGLHKLDVKVGIDRFEYGGVLQGKELASQSLTLALLTLCALASIWLL